MVVKLAKALDKIKISALAKEINKDLKLAGIDFQFKAKELAEYIKNKGYDVKSFNSILTINEAAEIKEFIKKEKILTQPAKLLPAEETVKEEKKKDKIKKISKLEKKIKKEEKVELVEDKKEIEIKPALKKEEIKEPPQPIKEVEPVKEKVKEKPLKEIKPEEPVVKELKKLLLPDPVSIRYLSIAIDISATVLIKELLFAGMPVTINQSIPFDKAAPLAEKFGYLAIKEERQEDVLKYKEEIKAENLVARPPVVTIMGHVDHGKTKLLDAIRRSNIIDTESGGITQHIGAYLIEHNNKKITFIDTPGHEAFTAMRARGAKVTDIVILVVAADDGIMPQTIEAINHAKAANVPIIVAINKIDKPNTNVEKVKQQLTNYDLVPEEWGGSTVTVPISAKMGIGIQDLLEYILLQAEILELKSTTEGRVEATVIEARLDKGKGALATVLVNRGTLKVGVPVIIGNCWGKVRAMFNDKGEKITMAGPSIPVEISGLNGVPFAGDKLIEMDNEKVARDIATKRREKAKEKKLKQASISLSTLYEKIKEGEVKELNLIVKADVNGSLEALRSALSGIEEKGVHIKIIHEGVGNINENDVMLAAASQGIIIGFHTGITALARKMSEMQEVEIRLYDIIYEVVDEVKKAVLGLLAPIYEEVFLGRLEIRQVFKIPRVGMIAGCFVQQGKIKRNAEAKLLRDNEIIYQAKISSLKRFKEDVKEVEENFECGVALGDFQDYQEGDIIEVFVKQQVERK